MALKNRHQPQHMVGFSDDDQAKTYYSLYRLGSQTSYTPIAVGLFY
ncbi:hypothetical protein [Levilactobacillus sp. HBUAS70063]